MINVAEESDLPPILPSASEMAAFDAAAITQGTPALELMERAGSAVYEVIHERILQKSRKFERVVVLCGPGNNGGDGLVIARGLVSHGYETSTVLAACDKYSSDCHIQARKLNEKGHEFFLFGDAQGQSPGGFNARYLSESELTQLLEKADLIVDALLGTGQKSSPRGSIAEIILALEKALARQARNKIVVSVDTPSGIDTDSGQVFTPAVKADLTIAIDLIKRGMLQYPARRNCGEIVVQPIGIEATGPCEFKICQRSTVELPRRPGDFHKGLAGHVLVIAGSAEMPGAAALCCGAALKAGAGLTTLFSLSGVKNYGLIPEVMLAHITGQRFSPTLITELKKWLPKVQVVLVGPGLGAAKSTAQFMLKLSQLLSSSEIRAVIDADGLNHLASLKKLPKLPNTILTPHPGEAARLLRCTTKEVQKDRYGAARELATLSGAVVVLKGASTVIYQGKQGLVCNAGNPYMATAGSGDVLAGIIAALAAQGISQNLSLLQAAAAGVYLHARAGDLALAQEHGPLVASDITRFIGKAFNVG